MAVASGSTPEQNEMKLTATQHSALYFKRYKGSKGRAALFRQLRASLTNQTGQLKQQTFGNTDLAQELASGQRWLRGFQFLKCPQPSSKRN